MKLLSVSAAALVTSSFASAAIHAIEYTYMQSSKYAATKPMVGGVPDPNHLLGPLGTAIIASYGSDKFAPAKVIGKGWLDTDAGQIYLGPIDIEYAVVGGSYGYIGWSQTMNGSFLGANFIMATGTPPTAIVNGGSLVCELSTSTACVSEGGNGSPPDVLEAAQLYADPIVDEDDNPITPGGPRIITGGITFNGAIAEGVTGQYIHQMHLPPAYQDTVIDITVGKVVFVPIPAAAWLFAPSLMALVVGKRFRNK